MPPAGSAFWFPVVVGVRTVVLPRKLPLVALQAPPALQLPVGFPAITLARFSRDALGWWFALPFPTLYHYHVYPPLPFQADWISSRANCLWVSLALPSTH